MNENSLHILLAENETTIHKIFKETLNSIKKDYHFSILENGDQLMEFLQHPDVQVPEMLFLNLDVFINEGAESLSKIREIAKCRNLTIVIYCDQESEKVIEDVFVNGANIFIKKPQESDAFRAVLKRIINLNQQYNHSGLKKENFLLNIDK